MTQPLTALAEANRRGHAASTVALAERLHSVGWSHYAIAKLLKRQGISISRTTVAEWVDPEAARRRREQKAASYRRRVSSNLSGRLGGGQTRTAEFRIARIKALRAEGMTHNAVAIAMTFDFPGEPVTGEQVRYALAHDTVPLPYRKLLNDTRGGVDGR